MKRTISDEEKANIVDRYQRGQGLRFICLATDHNHETVRAILRAAGVKIRKSGRSASRPWGWTGEVA